MRIAGFISAHGYGHAARACAVLQALRERIPELEVDLFTEVPVWIFSESLCHGFERYETFTDVGVVQHSAMQEDLPGTVRRLQDFLPFREQSLSAIATQLRSRQVRLVLCDISSLGIASAASAGIPSVLVENFTWDWIYAGYLPHEPGLAPFVSELERVYREPNYHIQTRPSCTPSDCPADLVTNPVARAPRTTREEIRARLDIPAGARMVLITMGGIRQAYDFIERLPDRADLVFLIPGCADQPVYDRNIRLLPHHSDFYHPDLLASSDAVVGKVGYSTLAEAYHAGIPFGYVARQKLRESACLKQFVDAEMPCLEFGLEEFESGDWTKRVDELIQLPSSSQRKQNGAQQVADFLHSILEKPA